MIKSTFKHGNREISASAIFRNFSKVDTIKISSDFIMKQKYYENRQIIHQPAGAQSLDYLVVVVILSAH